MILRPDAQPNFSPGTLPRNPREEIMSVEKLSNGRWRVWYHYQTEKNGKRYPTKAPQTFDHRPTKAEVAAAVLRLSARRTRSLTSVTYGMCQAHYISEHVSEQQPPIGDRWYYRRAAELFGAETADQGFAAVFREKLQGLDVAVATSNKLRAIVRAVLRRAWMRGEIPAVPVRDWGIQRVRGRERVWTNDERLALLAQAERVGSPLYWPMRFLDAGNPIRAGDMRALTQRNYDRCRRVVTYAASKTAQRTGALTVLAQIPEELHEYFLGVQSEYLFPGWDGVSALTEFKTHWRTLCREAGVRGLRWHDLNHVAMTRLAELGISNQDIRGLHIRETESTINRYTNRNALDIVSAIRSRLIGNTIGNALSVPAPGLR